MNKLKMLLIIIVGVIGITSVTYLRHFIPALHNFFVATQLDAPLNAVDASISQVIAGNPSAILGVLGTTVTVIVSLVKLFKDKTSGLISTFSQEKAELSGNMSSLQTQFDTMKTSLNDEIVTLTGTVANQKTQIEQITGLNQTMQTQLIAAQKQLLSSTDELKTITAQKQELEIACQALTPTSSH